MKGSIDKQPVDSKWMYRYKRKILCGTLAVLTISIALTMVFIASTLRGRLIQDSKGEAREISTLIESSLRNLMLVRNRQKIQETLETIGKSGSTITSAFILDRSGRVVYSSEPDNVGIFMQRFNDATCVVCHHAPGAIPSQTSIILHTDRGDVLRSVSIIRNEQQCHACHSPLDKINGKLIIDRSMRSTYSLVRNVEILIAFSGAVCLVLLVSMLSKLLSCGVDTYINAVHVRSRELGMLYRVVERVSKTIDFEELKQIIVSMITEMFDPDEVNLIHPREGSEYGGVVWKKSEGKIKRRMAPEKDQYRDVIYSWMHGHTRDINIATDDKAISIPVAKGKNQLALILIKKESGGLSSLGSDLINAMRSHIAVAFENAALYRMAITDELTGVYSKRHFHQTMAKKFKLFEQFGEKLTLLMIDIDNFKTINDTYGHPAGDRILKDVAQCMVYSTRDQDFTFRYGGEEFCVLLPATDSSAGRLVAERIREMIEENTFSIGQSSIRLTVSIGEATCPVNAKTVRDLVLEADKALYEAKRTGKNRVVVSPAKGV